MIRPRNAMAHPSIRVEFLPGDDIEAALEEALDLCWAMDIGVVFTFNDVEMHVTTRDEVAELLERYHRYIGYELPKEDDNE